MDAEALKLVFDIGETIAVEFKRCGNGIESDTYETVCSFLNRFGGDIYLGVQDNGEVSGVSEKVAPDLVKNFIKNVNNPNMLQPTVYLEPRIIRYKDKTIIHIHIPPSSEVHSYKKDIFDRVDDADVKVTATSQIAAMYIRKQNVYTEKKVLPYLQLEDLRLDLLPRIKQMAINNAGGKHPWKSMNDEEVLKSAGLYGKDAATGESGYNLAAAMLLGKDSIILSVAPGYRTDALLRKVNVDRYDDRLIVETNLVESYDLLMGFAEKHLWDKFYIENDTRMSLRNIIAREMLVNTLIHREMTSSYIAKFVIEKDRMFVENANRATHDGVLTPDDFEPNPKNPIIASFFRNIGLSDQLGSGVRNLFKYGKLYSGAEPKIMDGDVFRIIMPLNDGYSFDMSTRNDDKKGAIKKSDKKRAIKKSDKRLSNMDKIIDFMKEKRAYKNTEIAEMLEMNISYTRKMLKELIKEGKIETAGANRNRVYIVKRSK